MLDNINIIMYHIFLWRKKINVQQGMTRNKKDFFTSMKIELKQWNMKV